MIELNLIASDLSMQLQITEKIHVETAKYFFDIINNLKGDPLEIQHLKFENSRLGFIESVHER